MDEIWEQKDRDGYGMGYPNPFLALGSATILAVYDFGGALAIQLSVGSSQKANAKLPKTVKFALLPTCPQFSNYGGVSQKWGWIPQTMMGR